MTERQAAALWAVQRARESLTLTGLAVQIDQLRSSLEAIAGNVRRHEEQLRRLNKQQRSN